MPGSACQVTLLGTADWAESGGRGPKSASARPGPCTRPRSADALTRRELPSGPTSGRRTPRSSRRDADGGDGQATTVGCGGSSLTPGLGRMVPRRAHRAGPIAELLGGGSEHTRCPRHRLIGRAHWRPCPLAPPPWSSDAAAGSTRRWWPACPTPTTTRYVPMDMPANCQSVRHGTPRSTSQLPMRSRH